ncbi:MAG: 5'-nucleotidase [Verrucomicrobiales bacterium]|jgi:5'-nucleotidase
MAITTGAAERGVFANRTLNLRTVPVVGYDMDYTLVHYHEAEWEGGVFEHARNALSDRGLPVANFVFDPAKFTVGLVFDLELGNLLKATRFGRVVRAQHGNELLTFEQQRDEYGTTIVELSSPRFIFMNTLFELSRASLFCQLIASYDEQPLRGIRSYTDVYRVVDEALTVAHQGGALKAAIVADKERFVHLDPDMAGTLQEQRLAGKRLVLITNSDWAYTREMMPYCFDRYIPGTDTWRSLFDVVIVSANKPRFFLENDPIYRVVDEDESLLHPHFGDLEPGHVYFGGNAKLVERSLNLDGGQPLYVGDHLFGDVHVTKDVLRWRTALIARELESEIRDVIDFADQQAALEEMMGEKVELDRRQARLRLEKLAGGGKDVADDLSRTTAKAVRLDEKISPLARAAGEVGNPIWGPLMRAGNDKSLFARQVERYADVYTSRVSNFRAETPFAYLRAARGSLPHDSAGG